MASDFLKKKAEEQSKSTSPFSGDVANDTSTDRGRGGISKAYKGESATPSAEPAKQGKTRASSFLQQQAAQQTRVSLNNLASGNYDAKRGGRGYGSTSPEALSQLLQRIQGLETPGPGDGLTTSSGFYSRPAAPEGLQEIYKQISHLIPTVEQYGSPIGAAQSELMKAESDLQIVNTYLQKAQEAYNRSPTQQNADVYNQIAAQYVQMYQEYSGIYTTYQQALEKYNSIGGQMHQIVNAYQQYTGQQQAAFDNWRGTIRDAETIQMEIDAIDQQIKEQKKAEKAATDAAIPLEEKLPSYVTGNYANGGNTLAYALGIQAKEQPIAEKTVSPEMQRLLDLKALLQEEYDWSMYYHYADMMQASDFAKNSAYIPEVRGEKNDLGIAMGAYTDENSGWEDPLYEAINGNVEAQGYVHLQGGMGGSGGMDTAYGMATNGKQESRFMTPEEISIYNYLLHTQGKQAAREYYDYVRGDLYLRQREDDEKYWTEYASNNPFASSVFSILTSPMKSLSYVGQLTDYLDDGKIDQNTPYNRFAYANSAIRTEVSKKIDEKWGKVGSFGYNTAISMLDFLYSTALTGNNQAMTLTIMGSGAAADTVIAAKDRGLSDGQAFWLGTIAGLAEAGMESINMETVFNPELLKDGIWKYILKNATAEGLEEVGTDAVNLVADILISKDQSEWQMSIDNYMKQGYSEAEAVARAVADQALTMGADFFGGALSGGILSGSTAGIHANHTSKLGKELGDMDLDEEDIQAFIETGLESDPETASYQLAVEMQAKIEAGETLSNYDLARLYQANVQAIQAEKETDGSVKDPEDISLSTLDGKTDGEVSAKAMLTQAKADLKAGKITDAEFDAIMDDVMHLEELEDGTSVKTFDSHAGINTQTDSINANANGGTRYESTYERTAGPAAAEPAGEFDTQRADIPDGVPIRDAGQGAGIQTGQMASGARGQRAQANSQAKAVIERQNTAGDLRQRGLISYTSSWALGIESGTDTENLLVMPEECHDTEMRQAAQLVKAETGLNVAFTVGKIQVERRGRTWEVRGVHTGQQIVAQCDNTKATAMQLVKHEIFHDKAMKDPGLTQRLKEEIRERFGPQEFDAVMDWYIDELWPLYGPADETAWEEYEGAYNAILEEMLADAYAGINAFGAHAERFTETVRELTSSNTANKQQKQENGTEEPTGPPSDRYSYAGENANNADLDALARAKEMQAAGVADETIRQQTGWHTGMDGKWRWEIDDSKMQYTSRGDLGLRERRPEYDRYRELLDKSNRYVLELSDEALTPEETAELQKLKGIWGGTFRKAGRITEDALPADLLSDYVKHDDLFEAYPQLRKTRLRFADLPEGTRGQYDPEQDVITLSESLRGKPQDTLIHEIQHVIQKAEGFAQGSSPEFWDGQQVAPPEYASEIQKAEDTVKKVEAEFHQEWPDDINLNLVKQYIELDNQLWGDGTDPIALQELADQMDQIEQLATESGWGDLFNDYYYAVGQLQMAKERAKLHRRASIDLYRNTAGEIEARDAASRRQLTAEQRRSAEPARADDRTVFVEDVDEMALAEMDVEYGPQMQSYFDPDISDEEIGGNIQAVAQMDPVVQITGEEFAKGEKDLITQVEDFFGQLGNSAYNEQLGDVILDRRGIKSDIAHGIGRKKAAAFAAVPDVISQGLIVDYQQNWKDRGYDTAVVAAPITIGTEDHIAAVILTRSNQTNRFYVHEVLTTKNGAMPFKTGAQKKGDPGGDAPSVFSILDKIRSVKNGSTSQEKFSADDVDASGANGTRESMTAKEREILRGVETRLLNNIRGALGVTKFGDRSYLKSVIHGLSDTYLESGTIEQQAMDDLFEQAYRQGIVADRELHDQYEEVRKYLHTVSLTLDPRDRSDIADYPDFVKRMRGRMRIVNEGGLPVDSAWHELNGMAPELFPDSIAHPADQLVRMTKVLNSLRIVERSVTEYYGSMSNTYKSDAKAEFERAVWESIGELRQIRRFEQERQQKLQEAEPAPTTPEEAMEAWTKLKTARKTYERAMAKNLLTDEDEIAVGELLKGKMLPEHLDKDNLNVKGILAVYEAKQEYERLTKLLAEYRRKVKADIRAEADTYLETANTWKDKSIGLAYSRETMQRNVEDIVPDKKLAKRINERYFEPVRDAEAAAVKMKEGYREAARKLNLSRKVKKGDLVSEAHAVQLYGEAMDNIRILEKARGRLKHRDGKSLEEWRGVVYKLWQESPSLDKAKIESAVAEMRRIYDELFQKMNEVRVRWGYEPVNYRQGYFPHFQPGNGDGIMAQFGRALGIDTQVVALPTTINGLTHTFKPGIQWFGNAQERLGFNTAYDAVEGFDRYIEGVASVICQTENIQRLRALASQIRYRTSDDGIRKQVDAIYSNAALTEEQKNDAISGIYEKGRYTLSNFVVEVDEYTNLLANKKSKLDRTVEALIGRKFYTAMKWLESRVGANMIAGNVTSALTNFIPLTQASAQLSKKAMLQGMWDTLASYKMDDGIIDRSAFLTNRRGSDPLVKVWSAKVSEVLGKPMELFDSFTAGSIVRAAYHQNLKQGLSESEAMHQADIFASRVMAERSKGGMPTLFESKNPFFKLFTQFQLEVNNQWSEVLKDIPRAQREKGLGALALVFLQYFLGAWLFNDLYEKWIGRRPAMDPIDIVLDTVKDFASDDVSTTDALSNLANNVLEELPFSSALTLAGIETDGGRVPVSSGIPNIPALVNAATNEDWAPEKRWKEAQDELNKLAYVIPPFGGNQVSKIWKGIKAYVEGGSYSVDSDGNDILQYPVYNDESGDFWGLVQAMLLGKSALPEAREWVEDGFDSFSAKQTAIYQDMIDAGVSEREAYDLIDSLRSASETEEASKKEAQIGILQNADATDECKAIAFYGLLATDNERILMDSLADAGAQPDVVMDTLIQLRDAAALPAADKKAAQADILITSALTESEKEIVIRSWLDDQEVNENGNLTNLGKFNLAMKRGITTDEYLQFRATGMDIDKLLEYTAAGFKADEALDLAQAVHDLNPLPGEDRVSTLQKWRASVDFSDDVEDQLTALSMIMEPKSLAVWETANNYGVPPVVYVTFQETATQYDTDGNGSYTQAEAKAVIDAEFSHLTTAQKAVLWQWVCYSSGSKKNPYDPTVGQSFIDSRDAAKTAVEE